MGNDLYWMRTPVRQDYKYNGLSYGTWHKLTNILGKEEREELDGVILTKDDLPTLRTVLATSKACGDNELTDDMSKLIAAITKTDSITLVIRG